MKPNKGVKDRARRDLELEEVDSKTIESARIALERKSKVYEKLQRGLTGGLSEKQYETLLVDVRLHHKSSCVTDLNSSTVKQ